MIRRAFLMATTALVLLAGCAKNEPLEDSRNANDAITFGVSAGKQTRAPIVGNANVQSKPFGLYAYYTAQQDWATYVAANSPLPAANFMSDQQVAYSAGSGKWEYSPLKYWPNTSNDKISFFAYWPKDASVVPVASATGLPKITYTLTGNAVTLVDFTVSALLDQQKKTGAIVLPFRHVLTRLNFSAKVDRDLSTGATFVYVTGVRVLGTASNGAGGDASGANAASKFYSNAEFQFGTDESVSGWGYTNSTRITNPMDVASILNTATNAISNYTSTSVAVNRSGLTTPLLKTGEYLFLIPPGGLSGISSSSDVRVQVDYDIVTVDAGLSNGYSKTSTSATISLTNGTLVESKAYNFIFTFGLTGIELSAELRDWDTEIPVDATSVNAASAAPADVITAMGALNTAKGVNPNNNYFTVNVPVAAPASLDVSAAVSLYNFVDGDQIELKFTSSTPATVTLPTGWVYQTDGGKAVLRKNSPKGWYMGDLTGIESATTWIILNSTATASEWEELRLALLGPRTRAVSAGTITLLMPYMTIIPTDGFYNCTALVGLSLPNVTSIGNKVFEGCTNLTAIALAGSSSLISVGTELFGSSVTNLTTVKLTVGLSVTGTINLIAKTWNVNGTTYTFGDGVVVENFSGIPESMLSLGQQSWGDGGTITIP